MMNTPPYKANSQLIQGSKLICPFNKDEIRIFFSLVDYRNNYFTSDDPEKIIEFYNSFENRDQLIQWMKERPKGRAKIIEVEGDKEIIVVIPTAYFNGKYAKECRENIFKGLHIVFVESGFPKDPYFNYAHNCNVGIKKAMEYKPKWIILSNDDMYKIDDIGVLRNDLESIDSKVVSVVFTEFSEYHSVYNKVTRRNWIEKKYLILRNKTYGKTINLLLDKFNVNVIIVRNFGFRKYLTARGYSYVDFIDFCVFSYNFLNANTYLFDENFINQKEDSDFSLFISTNKIISAKTQYKIGDMIGSALGTGLNRVLRSIASDTYFNYKWKNLMEKKMGHRAFPWVHR
ncbi:MAG: hypothetical protein QXU18_15885 [Thermoplasmatales archaeon]